MTNYSSSLYQPQAYQPNTEGKPRHCLLICGSPLQVLIAEQIITLNPRDTFDAILITSALKKGRSPKYEYYFERIKQHTRRAYYIPRQEDIGKFAIYKSFLSLLKRGVLSPSYNVIYLGPVLPDVGLLLFKQKKALIFTLDEGSANLVASAMHKLSTWELGRLYKYIHRIFPSTNLLQARRDAYGHITIYNLPHTSPKAYYIPLLNKNKEELTQYREKISTLMIGQPLYSFEEEKDTRSEIYSQSIIDYWGISYYLPHPRESFRLKRVEYIDTPMVAEDWILQYLKDNPDTRLIIYTYCSSTVLNLQGLNGIEFVCIRPEDCPHYLLEVYDISSQSSSVRVLDVAFDASNRLRVLNSGTR